MRRTRLLSVICSGALLPLSLAVPVATAAGTAAPQAAQAGQQGAPPAGPQGALAYTTYTYPATSQVVVTSATGKRPVHLGLPAIAPDTTTFYSDVEYSADGDRVALVSGHGLALTDPQFSAVSVVSPTPLSDVEWAPGSSQTLYGASGTKLVRLDLRAGASAKVTTVATLSNYLSFVRPSPDGRWVAVYLSDRYQPQRILLVDLRDGSVRTVPYSGSTMGAPGWDLTSGQLIYSTEDYDPSFSRALHAVDPVSLADDSVVVPEVGQAGPVGESDAAGHPYLLDESGNGGGRPTLYTVDVATGTLTTLGQLPQYRFRGQFGEVDLGSAPGGVDPVGSCAGYTATITGTDGDDTITGTPGDDVILAGAGDDIVDGGGGDDVVCGGPGNDTLTDLRGDNRLYGGDGDDHLTGGPGNDLVGGDAGNDTIDAGDGHNAVSGGDGDDHLTTGSGADQVRGGAGVDTITTNEGNDVVYSGRGIVALPSKATAALSVPRSKIDTGSGDDVFYGPIDHTTVDLGPGNDRLTGFGTGFDIDPVAFVDAGPGNDVIVAGLATVDAGPGDDIVGSGAYVNGGPGDDIIGNGSRRHYLGKHYSGGDGDDTIYNGVLMDGGPGADHLVGDRYNRTTAHGDDGNDTIADVFVADGGNGDDVITGTNQAAGGEGDDTISLQRFYQVTTAPTGDGGPGDDTIDGSGVADVIHGGAGDDTIQGKAGDDQLYGDSGRDKLSGGYGEDALDGGTGNDLCHPDGDVTPTASCEILVPRG